MSGTGTGPDATFEDAVATQTLATPDRIAVRDADSALTYSSLSGHADRLAKRLRGRGVGSDRVVGVWMPPSVGMLVSLLGILRAGGAYLPLDPAYPEDRLRFMTEDGGARIVLTRGPTGQGARLFADRVDLLDIDEAEEPPLPPPLPRPSPDSLAYLMYTSGSTGRPKGVAVTRRNLAHLVALVKTVPIDPGGSGIALAVTSPSFDVSVWEMVVGLTRGLTLVMLPAVADDRDIGARVAECAPQIASVTPALLASWSEPVTSLRTLLVGGEICPAALVALWTQRARLFNVYGPTECTVLSTWTELASGDDPAIIGRPAEGVQTYVLDEHLRPVAAGAQGELYLAGRGVARGYHRRPGLTAARFLPDPFGPPGSRMYRSGDRARRLPDGRLQFLGRSDAQIKLHGHRIELGEIDNVLATIPDVQAAAATVVGEADNEALAAAVVLRTDDVHSLLGLALEHCRQLLPEHMVPAEIFPLKELPATVGGKVDRDRLSEVLLAERARRRRRAPRGDDEEMVAEIWTRVLGTEVDDVDLNFFALGGQSLQATRVVSEIRRVTGVRLPVRTFFAGPTVAALAAEVVRMREELMCFLSSPR